MSEIIWFTDKNATEHSEVGGKGANLGRLSQAGFPVPAGFVVPASAYLNFLAAEGLDVHIRELLTDIADADADLLEERCGKIRELVMSASLPPALAEGIGTAYAGLGSDTYVAVRSSGTAEDLEGASFAGLHDTYLDIRGTDDVVDGVKRCWASLWATRAVSYRNTKGFDHFASPIAVVVQTMVESQVSGVMFTGNPMTSATDEIVINASWGLGEAIVGGIATPDEFIVYHQDLSIAGRTLGDKQVRIVRNPDTGLGVVTQDTPAAERSRYCLTDAQVAELSELGRRVQTAYGELPQDTEWALHDGRFYLLQARPVTGVEFSWDEGVNDCLAAPDSPDYLWSRSYADEVWTGACTPLMFSWRAVAWYEGHSHAFSMWGHPEPAYARLWTYRKGQVYFNANIDDMMIRRTMPPPLRAAIAAKLPSTMRENAISAPFSYTDYLRSFLRIRAMEPAEGFYKWFKTIECDYHIDREAEFDGLTEEQLRALSDKALRRYVVGQARLEDEYYKSVWTGFMLYYRDMISLFGVVMAKWYTGDNPSAMMELITGTRVRTTTAHESVALWKMGRQIRESATLTELFETHEDGEFFAACEGHPDPAVAEFITDYREFMRQYGHRGHEDRDIYFLRRADDPSIDYRALRAIVASGHTVDPEQREHELNTYREALYDEVAANIRRQPLGALKAEAFKVLYDYAHKFLVLRDEERAFVDRSTYSIRKGCLEINRRLQERGLVQTDRDFWFLSMQELFDLMEGRGDTPLTRAKITGRMRDFDRLDSKQIKSPMYIQNRKVVDLDAPPEAVNGVLHGSATSRGKVTGTARVIGALKDIGRIESGDILITNSTDPGWTPVFLVINGIVLETGGMLAHGSLLAREYGFPAVQVGNAMSAIPDGATITVDGDTGTVTIHDADQGTDPTDEPATPTPADETVPVPA